MLKQLIHGGKFRLGHAVDPGPLSIIIVGVLGLGFLVAEGAVLSAQGTQGIAVALIAGAFAALMPNVPLLAGAVLLLGCLGVLFSSAVIAGRLD